MKKIIHLKYFLYTLLIGLVNALFILGTQVAYAQKRRGKKAAKNNDGDATDAGADGAAEAPASEVGEKVGEAASEAASQVTGKVGDTISTATDLLSPSKIITVLLVFFFVWLTIKGINILFDYMANRMNRYRLRILRMQPIVNIIIWIVAIYSTIISVFNPEPETIYAVMASSALALGFAAQDLLKNIFGGFMIIFDRPFQIGDRIQVGGDYGEVVNIGVRTTQINTLDDNLITVPNSKIISDMVSNANAGALDCMVVVNLWLPIHINVEQVRKIAYEAAITSKYVNLDKAVNVLFFDHFDNHPTTNVKIKSYVLDARYEKAYESDVTEAAKKALKELKVFEKPS